MEKYTNYINRENILKYYLLDWDENILEMETKLHYKKKVNGDLIDYDMSPKEYAIMRSKYYSYKDNEEWLATDKTFMEFRDIGPRGNKAFIEDVITSVKSKNFGPSWYIFKDALISGNLFAIITTRGHEPDTLKGGVVYIIENVLTESERNEMKKNLKYFNSLFGDVVSDDKLIDDYLEKCYFIGLSSKAFRKQFKYDPRQGHLDKGKQDAIDYFVTKVRGFAKIINSDSLKIGFSDDDVGYVEAAKELFMSKEKSIDFVEEFYVFDTSNPEINGGIKTKI